jgi:hypothetical protein
MMCAAPQQKELVAEAVEKLFKSLKDAQKDLCVRPWDDAGRDLERFTAGPRPGMLVKDLTDEQAKLLDEVLKNYFSDEAYKAAVKAAGQGKKDGIKEYYFAIYGDPVKDKRWSFRLSENHLTFVHVAAEPQRFGPVLLGSNPADAWTEQEEAAIAAFSKLTDDDRKKCVLDSRALSGTRLGLERGCPVGDLSAGAKEAVAQMVEARIKLFADDQQKRLRDLVKGLGIDKLRIAFFGTADKKCADGGRYDWKIEGKSFLLDFEGHRGHIHMTFRSNPELK